MPRMSEILKMQIWSCYCPLKNSPMSYQYQSELTRLYVIDLAHAFSFMSHHLTPTHPLFFLCFRRVIFYFLNIVCGSGPLHYQVSLPRRFFFLGKWRLLHTRTHLSCPPPPPTPSYTSGFGAPLLQEHPEHRVFQGWALIPVEAMLHFLTLPNTTEFSRYTWHIVLLEGTNILVNTFVRQSVPWTTFSVSWEGESVPYGAS